MNPNNLPTEICLKQGNVSITLELNLPFDTICECLEHLGAYTKKKSHYRSLASYYQAYSRKVIPADKIIYIEANRAYCIVHLCDGSKRTESYSMGRFFESHYCNSDSLVRIHKTYVVNRNFIKQKTGGYVVLNDNTRLPIGRKYKKNNIL
jgi:DNA-binding LytR/AlgR family response regulator